MIPADAWSTAKPWDEGDKCTSNFVVRLIEITTGRTWPYTPPCTSRRCPVHWQDTIAEDFDYLAGLDLDRVLAFVYWAQHRHRLVRGRVRQVDVVRERMTDRLRRQKPVYALTPLINANTGFPSVVPPGFVAYRRWTGQALLFSNIDLGGREMPKRGGWVSLETGRAMVLRPLPGYTTSIARRDWSDSWRPPKRPSDPLIRALWTASRQHDAAAVGRATEGMRRLGAQPDWAPGLMLPPGMTVEQFTRTLLDAKAWVDRQRGQSA